MEGWMLGMSKDEWKDECLVWVCMSGRMNAMVWNEGEDVDLPELGLRIRL